MARWLNREQLAIKLGCHPNTVYRYERIPGFPKRTEALGHPRWYEPSVDDFMAQSLSDEVRARIALEAAREGAAEAQVQGTDRAQDARYTRLHSANTGETLAPVAYI